MILDISKPTATDARLWNDSPRFEQQNREVLERFKSLETALKAVATIATTVSNDRVKENLSKELHTIQNDIEGVRKYLSFQLPPKYYNECRTADSTIAQEALNIPELLEWVLLHADVNTVLNMSQVSREIRDSIHASPPLQVKLGFKAANTSVLHTQGLYSTPFSFGFYGFEVAAYSVWGQQSPDANFNFTGVTCKLPRIGAAWKRMLICQPPVTEMRAYLDCTIHTTHRAFDLVVTSATGLTVSDLYQAAKRLIEQDIPCTHCDKHNKHIVADEDEVWRITSKPLAVRFSTPENRL